MTDKQAAGAQERIAAIRKRLRWFAGRTTMAGNEMAAYVRELCDVVDALSARLAQAEQEANEAVRDKVDYELNASRREAERQEQWEARLREYEEALQIADEVLAEARNGLDLGLGCAREIENDNDFRPKSPRSKMAWSCLQEARSAHRRIRAVLAPKVADG